MNYSTIIENRLSDLLHQNNQISLKGKHFYYALENAVSREDWTISESGIIREHLVDQFLQTTAEGRSWIHANLIPINESDYLITIRVGAKVGNPNPSVNLSFEINHSVRIII